MTGIYAFGTFSQADGQTWPGVARADSVAALADLLPGAPVNLGLVLRDWSRWDSAIDHAVNAAPASVWRAATELTVHLPYKPENLYGAGANYHKHVVDLIVDQGAGGLEHLDQAERRIVATKMMDDRALNGTPYVWIAARSSIAGSHDILSLPREIREPDWELELAVVIGKPTRRVSRADALGHVAGYTIANDVTARDLVHRSDMKAMGMDWLASKNPPGFNILGPYITPARFVPDPQRLHIRLMLNGEVKQDEGTDDMIFGVARLIEYVSAHVQLEPGDIIMTGSPSGNGSHYQRFLQDGDVMVGEVDGLLGSQHTVCRAEST